MTFDFDTEAGKGASPFLSGITKNVSKLHAVLVGLLPPEQLKDVFSRVFNYLDTKIPELYKVANDWSVEHKAKAAKAKGKQGQPNLFFYPSKQEGKDKMTEEIEKVAKDLGELNVVEGGFPTCVGRMKDVFK